MPERFSSGYALLISVNENAIPRYALPDVEKDVTALEDVLTHPERCAYDPAHVRVLKGRDATRSTILESLKQLAQQVQADATGNSTAVIYFSGHGWRDQSAAASGYFLIPYDMSERPISQSALSAADFAAAVAALAPRRLLVILDCCHAGGMGAKGLELDAAFTPPALHVHQRKAEALDAASTPGDPFLATLSSGIGRAVLTSSQGDQRSYLRKDRRMSIFTFHLIEALTGHAQPAEGATEVFVSDLMSHMSRHVPISARYDWNTEQQPDYHVVGNFPIALLLGGKGLKPDEVAPDPFAFGPDAADPQRLFEQINLSGYVGRGWLEREVKAFLLEHDRGYFILEAEAGLGKTTFLAHLVHTYGWVRHFCGLKSGAQTVEGALKGIMGQLALAYELDFGAGVCVRPASHQQPANLHELFGRAAEANRTGQKIVLIIDALDQAETPDHENALGLPFSLPKGVYIIAAQRPAAVTLKLNPDMPQRFYTLAADDERNEQDVRRFLEQAVTWPGVARALARGGASAEQLIDTLVKKCSGVWVYLYFVMHEIEGGRRTLTQLDLPDGLAKYYLDCWTRERSRSIENWDRLWLPLLAELAARWEPVTIEELCASAGHLADRREAGRLMEEEWCAFIHASGRDEERRYRFYHATLHEFFAGLTVPANIARAEKGFIEELRQATLAALRRILFAARLRERKRRYALQLLDWRGISALGQRAADDLLEILDLAARFAFHAEELKYLIERITAVLASPVADLDELTRARLLVYRAGLHGNLGQMHDAETDYRGADEIVGQWHGHEADTTETLELQARIAHGLGTNAIRAAEAESDPTKREAHLANAISLLSAAVAAAQEYAQDRALTAIAGKELGWAYELMADWPAAEASHQAALELLEAEPDAAIRNSYTARVLEAAGCMYYNKGDYQAALRLVEDEIRILEPAGPSKLLCDALINWGEYLIAVDAAAVGDACTRWRSARYMASLLESQGQLDYANELLQEHC